MADGIYRPAIPPMDLAGLFLEGRAQRQRQEQFRAQMEAKAAAERQQALQQSMDIAFKTGDYNLAVGLYDATTPLGAAGDYEILNSMAKIGKQQQKAEEARVQYQQTGPQLQQGIQQTFAPLQLAKLQGRAPSDAEQAAFGQAHLAAAQGLGAESPYLRGVLQGGVTGGMGEAAQLARKSQYETWFNRESGKFVNVRNDDMAKQDRLSESGYFPVSSVNMGGTPKDFATQMTPAAGTQVQNKLVGLMESNDRLTTLRQEFDPKYFEYGTQAKVWGLQKLRKAGGKITPKQEELLTGYNEFMRTVGEETLSYTVAIAASTFTDRLREHIESIRLSPDLDPPTAIKRIENLQRIGQQSVARLNFALRNGIVAATDFDPSTGDLTPEGRNKLEQSIPAYIPGFSTPSSPNRIDKLMENRADALFKEAALNQIPASEREDWVRERMNEEFFSAPPIGTEMQDVVESDLLSGLGQAGVPLPPEEAVPQLNMRRVR